MVIKIVPTDIGPTGKVADAELHFTDGPLEGLKLIGFSVWQRRTGGGFNVTFPARSYAVNGERRSFALLRPTQVGEGADTLGQERVRNLIIEAWVEHEAQSRPPSRLCLHVGQHGVECTRDRGHKGDHGVYRDGVIQTEWRNEEVR
jgi:hypothetical protein